MAKKKRKVTKLRTSGTPIADVHKFDVSTLSPTHTVLRRADIHTATYSTMRHTAMIYGRDESTRLIADHTIARSMRY